MIIFKWKFRDSWFLLALPLLTLKQRPLNSDRDFFSTENLKLYFSFFILFDGRTDEKQIKSQKSGSEREQRKGEDSW